LTERLIPVKRLGDIIYTAAIPAAFFIVYCPNFSSVQAATDKQSL
jgi:hypothetical protein